MSETGRLVAIFIYPGRGGPAQALDSVEMIAGRGLDGDHDRHPRRHATVISAESWREALSELGVSLPFEARRANLVLEGVPLPEALGGRIRIGAVELAVGGETTPCGVMDAALPGLREALAKGVRCGVYTTVVTPGRIRVGDRAELVAPLPEG